MPRVQGLLQVRSATAALLLAVLLGGAATAGAQGVPGIAANKCLAGKTKCVSKKLTGLFTCREKCQQDPAKCNDVESACEAKVRAKFDGGGDATKGCFAKLEAKANPSTPDSVCTTTGDSAKMEVEVDGAAATLTGTLEGSPPPSCPTNCIVDIVNYWFNISGAPSINAVCGYDAGRHAGFVMSQDPGNGASLAVSDGECMVGGIGSSPLSDAEQAACAPLAAQVVTAGGFAGGGQPCDIFP
jgi:hypothetical protein